MGVAGRSVIRSANGINTRANPLSSLRQDRRGKTTLARRLASRPATLLVSEDHWTSHLFADDLKTIEDYGRLSARLRAAMGPHIVDILRHGLSVVAGFSRPTPSSKRSWMRSLIADANVAHELHWLDIPTRSAWSGSETEMRAVSTRFR